MPYDEGKKSDGDDESTVAGSDAAEAKEDYSGITSNMSNNLREIAGMPARAQQASTDWDIPDQYGLGNSDILVRRMGDKAKSMSNLEEAPAGAKATSSGDRGAKTERQESKSEDDTDAESKSESKGGDDDEDEDFSGMQNMSAGLRAMLMGSGSKLPPQAAPSTAPKFFIPPPKFSQFDVAGVPKVESVWKPPTTTGLGNSARLF